MSKFQRGQVLLVVVAVALLASFIMIRMLLSSKQTQSVNEEAQSVLRFNEVSNRLKNLLSADHLCTCNLGGITITVDAFGNPQTRLIDNATPLSISPRKAFGIFELTSTLACVSPAEPVGPRDEIILSVNPALQTPEQAVHASYVAIFRFCEMFSTGPVPPNTRYFKANFGFSGQTSSAANFNSDKFGRTNADDPIPVEIFLVLSGPGPDMVISSCFVPYNTYFAAACN